jgi:hypothetical protein
MLWATAARPFAIPLNEKVHKAVAGAGKVGSGLALFVDEVCHRRSELPCRGARKLVENGQPILGVPAAGGSHFLMAVMNS